MDARLGEGATVDPPQHRLLSGGGGATAAGLRHRAIEPLDEAVARRRHGGAGVSHDGGGPDRGVSARNTSARNTSIRYTSTRNIGTRNARVCNRGGAQTHLGDERRDRPQTERPHSGRRGGHVERGPSRLQRTLAL